MDKRRVVITGLGTVNPIGNDVESSWESIRNSKVGIAQIQAYDASNCKVRLAAEVKNFEPELRIEKREIKHMARFIQFALYAASEAIQNSGIMESVGNVYSPEEIGVIISSGMGGMDTMEAEYSRGERLGFEKVNPYFLPKVICNIGAARVAIVNGFRGICSCPVAACAGGNMAIGDTFHRIRDGYENAIVCGGSEAIITELCIGGFVAMRALSTSDDPNRASIPFDKCRKGFVMGEGAGILVLEELEHAKKRNANIIAEVVGYGTNCDAYHVTSPAPNGKIGAACMRLALDDASVKPEQIDYINAHGTSTLLNDSCETQAIKDVFGEYAYKIPVSSTKSMTGHLLGAAGGVESVFSCLTIRDSFIPATANLREGDPVCDLDYVPLVGRQQEVNYILSNSLGFGGHNACLVFKKYEI